MEESFLLERRSITMTVIEHMKDIIPITIERMSVVSSWFMLIGGVRVFAQQQGTWIRTGYFHV